MVVGRGDGGWVSSYSSTPTFKLKQQRKEEETKNLAVKAKRRRSGRTEETAERWQR